MNIAKQNLTALLDANVLYSAPVRDTLLHLADARMFQPKWTTQIHREWMRNLLAKRPDICRMALNKTDTAMNKAFPDALVSRYAALMKTLQLPDTGDHHVLAAAIKGNASQIITANIKHFPSPYLKTFNIKANHPDDFIAHLI